MDANARSFGFLGNEGTLRVPFFQRAYVWVQDNWEELLSDLLQPTRSRFLGSIILKQQRTISGEPKELLIIDGQQRLTTLSILLKALYDSFSNGVKDNCKEAIRRQLFRKRQPTDRDYLVKIHHSRLDADTYHKVIQAGIDERSAEIDLADKSGSKILQCYRYFAMQIRKGTEEGNKALFNRILDSENKMLVVIDLTEDDDEQAIFDTINTSGVRLSLADTIKNALFQKTIEVFANQEEVIDLYRETWERVFMVDEDTVEYWETQRSTGRLRRDNLEILLHCIAVIKGFYDPDIHTLSELSRLYKKQLGTLSTREELRSFINDIGEYAKIYREKILSFGTSTSFSFSDRTQRLFHLLEVLQISTFHPFILSAFKNNAAEADRHLFDLEKFVIRRMISNAETKSYNYLCKEFIQNPMSIASRTIETTDEQVANGLRALSNKNASLLLFWVELFRRNNDRKCEIKELKYNYSLEHVMPQKWEEYWQEIPEKKNMDGTAMSAEDAQKDRDDKIDWIGNMTLLTSSLNSSIRNLSFEQKVNGDGRKKGMKAYAELSITKDDIVSRFDGGDVVWNEERIVERNNSLSREIEEIWGVLMSPSTMSEWSRSPTVAMKTGKSFRPDVEVEVESPAKLLVPGKGKGKDGESAEVRMGKEAAAAERAALRTPAMLRKIEAEFPLGTKVRYLGGRVPNRRGEVGTVVGYVDGNGLKLVYADGGRGTVTPGKTKLVSRGKGEGEPE